MTFVAWLWIALSVAAALVLAALIWLAGPLVSFGDAQPFDSVGVRVGVILVLWLIVGASTAWRIVRRRRAAAALEKAMTEAVADETDAPILKEKMEDALATLRRTAKTRAGALYELPWYLIIGPPGAGKTTALVNSGLKFPLAGEGSARAIQGVGGTRYCDWWFTDAAVLIDTAGRYTTQDSDAKVDRESWHAFLDMLRRNRPRQPINGVIVAISIADVLHLSALEVAAHADAIRKRLTELHEELKIDFPVYAVFTKMDLVVGFTQYFADLDEIKRQAVWGATFQTSDKKANNVGKVSEEMDLLIKRISERMPERLQEEPDLRSRAILFGLPAQLGAIRRPIAEFLNRIFEPTRYQTAATLRGFYFTSGTQEGTPFDSVIGALQRSYGVESFSAAAYSGVGKSFFLHDLLANVVFGEAGWVSTNLAAVRRSFALRTAGFALVFLATIGVLGLWWMSYARNAALITATERGVDDYAAAAAPLIKQNTVTDPTLLPIYELIGALPNLPDGYAHRDAATPIGETFGLSQRSRLQDASEQIYQQALERLMRPRLVLSLEQQIQKNIADPTFVYEALKVYLMLGGKAPSVDKDLIVSWFTRDWQERVFPGAPYAQGRALLRAHLIAMLDMDDGATAKISLNGPLVEQAQATLARMRVAERAYTLLKSEAHNEAIEDWVASQRGGPDMALVFEAANGASLDTIRVPAFFTYAGFYAALLDHMPTIADKLQKENWVLGAAGDQGAVKQQYASLFPGHSRSLRQGLPRRLERRAGQFAIASAARRRAEVSGAERRLGADLADQADFRIGSRRDRADARTQVAAAGQRRGGAGQERRVEAATQRLGHVSREAIDLAMKSQRKAGDPPPEVPGAAIEANFKPFQILVDGERGFASDRRPARQPQRAFSPADAGRGQSDPGDTGARSG